MVILVWGCFSSFLLGQAWNGRGDIESVLLDLSVTTRLTKFSTVSTASLVHMEPDFLLLHFFRFAAFGLHLPPLLDLACAATAQCK